MAKIFIFGDGAGNCRRSHKEYGVIHRDPTERPTIDRGRYSLRDVKLGPNGLERYDSEGRLTSVAGKPVER
ncbi:MAG TPA: hypothetical protein VN711_02435 [Candidatus Saccharimonadales bacterium]|nr:hypothetical protein [Candidatus Saccharimonadales bacterium]